MAKLSFCNIKLDGIVSCVPKQIVTTDSYDLISGQERSLFTKTTGIKERRVAPANVTCSDLCLKAARVLIDGVDESEIELVVFVSQSPDYFLPATSILMQKELGLSKNCLAFDVNLGCSGYIYGLSVVSGLLQNGQIKKALLLVGDKSTISTAKTDKSTFPLFGDAGTATLLSFKEGESPWFFNLQSDGNGKDAIIIEHGHSRNPYNEESEVLVNFEKGISRAKKHLKLDGIEIFNFALREAALNIRNLMEEHQVSKEEIDFFVFHQANKLINETVRKKLKVEKEKVPSSIEMFGNTSSASVPLTICYQLEKEIKDKPLKILLAGFGVGFSWGSVLLNTEGVFTKFVEYD